MPVSSMDGPSLGEIGRLLERVSTELGDFRTDVNKKFDRIDGTYVRRETYEALATTTATMIAALTADLERMQNSQSWLVRTVGGALIVLVVTGLYGASKVVGT